MPYHREAVGGRLLSVGVVPLARWRVPGIRRLGCVAPLMSPAIGRWPMAPPSVRCATHPSHLIRQQAVHSTVARRDGGGLRRSGGPRSEVKGETCAQPRSEDMSEGGHPIAAAQGTRKRPEGSTQPNDSNRPDSDGSRA